MEAFVAATILFIGGGNMTRAIVAGMLQNSYPVDSIYVLDRNLAKREFFAKTLQVQTPVDLKDVVNNVDIIALSVKPQNALETCALLHHVMTRQDQLIFSVMAGITTQTLNQKLGDQLAVVRAMPNMPSQIQQGATGLFANRYAMKTQKEQIEQIMRAIGIFAWVEQEEQLTTINALSGSGPAYYFYFMELMQKTAEDMGLPAELAKRFAIQTAYGASQLALESSENLADLRAKVTSKGGTTEAAIRVMQEKNLAVIFKEALMACSQRAIELSKYL